MKRRINFQQIQNPTVQQAAIDHKEATLQVILSKVKETSTFQDIGDLIGYSSEWVRQRLVKAPERLYRIGRRYQVPRGVALEFIRSVYST